MKYLKFAFLFYAIFMTVVMLTKPRIIFDQDGNPKKFGTGYGSHKTILPLWFVTIIGAVFSYVSSLLLFYQKTHNVEVSPDYQNQFGVHTPPQNVPSNNYIRTSDMQPTIPSQSSNYQWGLKKNYQSGGSMGNNDHHLASINHSDHLLFNNRSYPSNTGEYYQNYHPIDWNQSW